MENQWSPSSWQSHEALQQPNWPDEAQIHSTLETLAGYPPLVFAGESRDLRTQLARVANGEALLLQAGDCAESFDAFNAVSIRERLKIILQMAAVLTYSAGVPVVKVGRIAGQFAKPRSSDTELVDGVEVPSFRGHIVNDPGPTLQARVPDPQRLIAAYHQSAATLNLLRAFTKGGFADLHRVHAWTQEFVAQSPEGGRYEQMANDIDRALRFMAACGLTTETIPSLHEVDFFTSHEALILGYEQALTRQDSITAEWYDCSAHMVWIGERTRDLDGAHIEFFRGIKNPVGCKIGPTTTPAEVLGICETLNPERIPGRLTLISRMGAENVEQSLTPLVEAVTNDGHCVVWSCDPMHGNTFTSATGRKTRHFDAILAELRAYFAVHRGCGTWPGGVHVELTSDDVTECLGGGEKLSDEELELRYETICDPRLNGRQSLDLAFEVAEMLGEWSLPNS
ncbi:MAG TPA: 3-deoxy-7-phosphoheptulonate synthase class II [Acidimicrobiaceae bacterium]|nr:3-deoxy-7-phosphoheptulonate synthase class II [Acidimicrobiaceae bacterium]